MKPMILPENTFYPGEKSFVKIDGDNLILSSVTVSDDDKTLIRVYNPTEKTINAKITVGFEVKSAKSIRLDGKAIADLPVSGNTISADVNKGKIFTIEISK